jgi:hypothetical protein
MKLIRINTRPAPRELRQFAGLWLLFVGVGAFIAWRSDAPVLATLLAAVALGVGVAGLLAPRSIRLVYLGAVYAAFPIGFVVSWLILGVVYFLVITPIGLCMRLARRDPLERRFERGAKSHWTPAAKARSPSDYFRQH